LPIRIWRSVEKREREAFFALLLSASAQYPPLLPSSNLSPGKHQNGMGSRAAAAAKIAARQSFNGILLLN
jgi:hypothetical protein